MADRIRTEIFLVSQPVFLPFSCPTLGRFPPCFTGPPLIPFHPPGAGCIRSFPAPPPLPLTLFSPKTSKTWHSLPPPPPHSPQHSLLHLSSSSPFTPFKIFAQSVIINLSTSSGPRKVNWLGLSDAWGVQLDDWLTLGLKIKNDVLVGPNSGVLKPFSNPTCSYLSEGLSTWEHVLTS